MVAGACGFNSFRYEVKMNGGGEMLGCRFMRGKEAAQASLWFSFNQVREYDRQRLTTQRQRLGRMRRCCRLEVGDHPGWAGLGPNQLGN
jgi:hypothetical protein